MKQLQQTQLLQTLTNKKYSISDINIIGVRNNTGLTDTFDDAICVVWKDGNSWQLRQYDATTDPGLYYLNNPMNVHGTAIVVPGQYKDSHKIGLHQGKYEALVQASPVAVYRDNNKDSTYNLEPKTIEKGIFGVNIHHANPSKKSTKVDRWSAACQVIADPKDFDEFLLTVKTHKPANGFFTYTLLQVQDIG